MPVNLASESLPATLMGVVSVSSFGVPRFWATIWSDVLNPSLEPTTRRRHLSPMDRLYQAVQEQHGADCLDRLGHQRTQGAGIGIQEGDHSRRPVEAS